MHRLLGALSLFVLAAAPASSHDFTWPASGTVTSNYYSPRSYGYHRAIDIAGPNGQSIWAARGGTCSFRGWSGGYGNLVILTHAAGYKTYYAHNSSFSTYVGQVVSRNETIAFEGSTGNSTGPHCHFEIRRWGSKLYIPASIGSYKTKGNTIPYNYAGIS
jgi:murein DD-endopeptidase MepM/ murein hydrolase activator NlpD